MQIATAPEVRASGVQCSAEIAAGPASVSAVETEAPLRVAVRTADPSAEIAPALAVKLAAIEPAGMATEAGTVTTALLLESATETPPGGAGAGRASQQSAVAPKERAVGVQLSDDIVTGAVKASVKD